ncbi:MAG: hypothetical protein ACXWMO_10780, partial [Syntrophales bacterium]
SYIEGSDEDDFIGLQECNNDHSCWVLTFSEKMGTYCISLLRAGRFIKEFRVSESEGLDYGKQFIRDLYKAGILEDLPADKRGKLDGIEF